MTEGRQHSSPRDRARAAWAASDLTYDILTPKNLARLRRLIDLELRESGLISGSFRAGRVRLSASGGDVADIRCRAYYFSDRQAVTFERNGFIGFAGWADAENIQPIVGAFEKWVAEMVAIEDREVEAQPGGVRPATPVGEAVGARGKKGA